MKILAFHKPNPHQRKSIWWALHVWLYLNCHASIPLKKVVFTWVCMGFRYTKAHEHMNTIWHDSVVYGFYKDTLTSNNCSLLHLFSSSSEPSSHQFSKISNPFHLSFSFGFSQELDTKELVHDEPTAELFNFFSISLPFVSNEISSVHDYIVAFAFLPNHFTIPLIFVYYKLFL